MTSWERVVAFHGHVCPGLAFGFRAAQAALDRLAAERSVDEELVAVVENDACGVDAVQVLAGCTFGKGNLIFENHGKPVYTIGARTTRQAVRVVVFGRPQDCREEMAAIRVRMADGREAPGDGERLEKLQDDYISAILNAPQEDLLKVERVDLDFPQAARIFASIQCSRCGESVMEPRARLDDGRPVCIPCHRDLTRGPSG